MMQAQTLTADNARAWEIHHQLHAITTEVNKALVQNRRTCSIYPYTDFTPDISKETWDKLVAELQRRGFKVRKIQETGEERNKGNDGLEDAEWELSW